MRVVITGASQGIGAATARACARLAGAEIFLVARNESNLGAVASDCRESGARAHVVVCDVTDEAAVTSAAAEVLAGGAPDLLVNNAGRFEPGHSAEISLALFRRQLDVNVTSAFLVTRALLPAMIAAGGGMIVFLGSVASLKAYPGGAAYCTAKHALLGYARSVREDTRESGVRVTTLLPGAAWTPSWEGAGIPPERMMPAEDVAKAIVDCWQMSDRTVVEELLLRPQLGDV